MFLEPWGRPFSPPTLLIRIQCCFDRFFFQFTMEGEGVLSERLLYCRSSEREGFSFLLFPCLFYFGGPDVSVRSSFFPFPRLEQYELYNAGSWRFVVVCFCICFLPRGDAGMRL